MNFADFSLNADLQSQLQTLGYETPSYAQAEALPRLLNKESVVVVAPQGSGASEIALIMALHSLTADAQALVLIPDAAAANRLSQQLRTIGKTKTGSVTLIEDAVPDALATTRVIFATPTAAAKALAAQSLSLANTQLLAVVHAQAYESAEDCKAIAAALPNGCQSYITACSETETAQQIFAAIQGNTIRIDCPTEARPLNAVPHQVWPVGSDLKRRFMVHFLKSHRPQRTLIYVADKTAGSHLARRLRARKFLAKTLFNQQSKLQSGELLKDMAAGKLQVLVTNQPVLEDAAEFDFIVNYDVPTTPADYQKRMQKAGNATLVSLVAPAEEEDILNIEFEVGRPLQRFESAAFDYTSAAPAAAKEQKSTRRNDRNSDSEQGRDRGRNRGRSGNRDRNDSYNSDDRGNRRRGRGREKEYVWDPEIPKTWGDRSAPREDPPKTPLDDWAPTPMPEFWFVDGEYAPAKMPVKKTKYPGISNSEKSEKSGKSGRRRRRGGKNRSGGKKQAQGQQQSRNQGQPQAKSADNRKKSAAKADVGNANQKPAGNKKRNNRRRRRRRGGGGGNNSGGGGKPSS